MLHPDLSHLNLLPSLYFLSHPFTCLNLGEKQGKRKGSGGWDRLPTEEADASIVCCWQFQAFLGHLQIPSNADSYRKFHLFSQSSELCCEFCHPFSFIFMQLILSPYTQKNALKIISLYFRIVQKCTAHQWVLFENVTTRPSHFLIKLRGVKYLPQIRQVINGGTKTRNEYKRCV